MALMRRQREAWPEPIDRWSPERNWLEWPWRSAGGLKRLLEEEVKVEEFTENEELVVRAELPGVDPDKDVDISIVNGNLRIRAERRHEEKIEHRDYRRTEIRYGSFARVLPLPANAKESDVKASYRDGILEVRAPIDRGNATTSKIPISRS